MGTFTLWQDSLGLGQETVYYGPLPASSSPLPNLPWSTMDSGHKLLG